MEAGWEDHLPSEDEGTWHCFNCGARLQRKAKNPGHLCFDCVADAIADSGIVSRARTHADAVKELSDGFDAIDAELHAEREAAK